MNTSATDFILATTSEIEGWPVHEYLGIVSADATMRTSLASGRMKAAAPRRGGPWATTIERRLCATRDRAIALMVQRAEQAGATAIIAVDIDYEIVHRSGGGDLLIVTATGTAVTLKQRTSPGA